MNMRHSLISLQILVSSQTARSIKVFPVDFKVVVSRNNNVPRGEHEQFAL